MSISEIAVRELYDVLRPLRVIAKHNGWHAEWYTAFAANELAEYAEDMATTEEQRLHLAIRITEVSYYVDEPRFTIENYVDALANYNPDIPGGGFDAESWLELSDDDFADALICITHNMHHTYNMEKINANYVFSDEYAHACELVEKLYSPKNNVKEEEER